MASQERTGFFDRNKNIGSTIKGNEEAAFVFAHNAMQSDYSIIPTNVVEITKKVILNTLGVIIAASGTVSEIKTLVEMVKRVGGKKESTVLGYGYKVPTWNAGYLNGAMAHCLHYDDLHVFGGGHIGSAVIPAAIAIAEWNGRTSGKEFITAVVLGCDVLCRLAMATKAASNKWSPHSSLGVFGSAMACGKLLGLDEKRLISALGIALNKAAGTMEMVYDEDSNMRDICLSLPGEEGVRAAFLAQQDIVGVRNSLEGPYGLFNVYYQGEYDRSNLLGDLGIRFPATDVGLKPWPAVVFTHVYIDAALQLVREHDISPDQVETITLIVGQFAQQHLCEPLEQKRKPFATKNALFSLPFSVATAIVRRALVIDDFLPPNLDNPEILHLAERICYRYDPDYDSNVRAVMPPGMVEICTRNGRIHSLRREIAYGHPQNPISWEDLVGKFKDCALHSAKPLQQDNVERAIEMLMLLEDEDDVGQVIRLLT